MSAARRGAAALGDGRFSFLFLVGLLALVVVLSVRDFYSYQFGFTPDSVEYALLAKSLVASPHYGIYTTQTEYEETHFPFGYPMVLIPFGLVTPRGFEAAALLSLAATLSSVALLFLAWRWFVPEVDARWRYPVTAMFALSPTTLSQSRLVLSEAIFTALLLVVFYFAARVLHEPTRRGGWVRLGIACFFMMFTRSIGLVCVAALGLYLLVALRKQGVRGLLWLGATVLLLSGVVLTLTPITVQDLVPAEYARWYVILGPFRDQTLSPPAPTPGTEPKAPAAVEPQIPPTRINPYLLDSDYLAAHLSNDLRRLVLLTGGGETESDIAKRLGLPWLTALPTVGMLALLFVGAGGWVWRGRALLFAGAGGWVWRGRALRLPPVSIFLFVGVCYMVAVFFWRGGGERIWYPVQPHLYLALLLGVMTGVMGVAALLTRVARVRVTPRVRHVPRVSASAVGVVLVLWLGLAVYRDLTLRTSLDMWGDLRVRAEVFDTYIEPNVPVASDWPPYDVLYHNRDVLSIPYASTAAELLAALQAQNVRYVVAASNDTFTLTGMARYNNRVIDVAPFLRQLVAHGALTPVYRNNYPLLILRVRAASQ